MNFLSHINYVDVAVVLFLIFISYRGYVSGFLNILFDSLAVIVSFYAANQYSSVIKQWMAHYLKFTVPWAGFAAYILTYMASFLFFVVWGRIMTKIFKMSSMGLFNNISGAVLNFIKWSLLIFLALLVVEKITIVPIRDYLSHSFVYQSFKIASAWDFVKEFIPVI
ncbi:MAG: CvpA family protein [Candidatus Riflemargulisbacteria bacterium]